MKKKLLILSAVIAASTTLVYADDYTSQDGKANYTYSSKDITIEQPGTAIQKSDINVTRYTDSYSITVTCDFTTVISNRTRTINTTLVSLNNSASNYEPKPESIALVDNSENNGVNRNDFFYDDEDNLVYTIKDNALYQKYLTACEHAASEDTRVVKYDNISEELKRSDKDADGYKLSENLYYMVVGKGTKAYVVPILEVNHKCTSGTIYTNCFDTYVPTYISSTLMSDDNLSISNEGKLCTVTGYVDQARIDNIISTNVKSKNCLNFDFTTAVVFGEINSNVEANKIAYFKEGANVAGQNIVVGKLCENYLISDGKEIYVNKAFTAGNATYNRTFTAGNYGTIVLPFAVPSTSGIFVKQARLASYDAENDIIKFSTAESIQPNVPYLFNAQAGGGSLEATNTPVSATPANSTISTDVTTLKFVGTFKEITGPTGFVISTAGNINKTKESTTIKAGRCYLTLGQTNAKLANTTIQIIDEDGSIEEIEVDSEVTAIDDIENGEVVATQYISINGQISNEPFNGMNIVKKTFANGTVETSKVVY